MRPESGLPTLRDLCPVRSGREVQRTRPPRPANRPVAQCYFSCRWVALMLTSLISAQEQTSNQRLQQQTLGGPSSCPSSRQLSAPPGSPSEPAWRINSASRIRRLHDNLRSLLGTQAPRARTGLAHDQDQQTVTPADPDFLTPPTQHTDIPKPQHFEGEARTERISSFGAINDTYSTLTLHADSCP